MMRVVHGLLGVKKLLESVVLQRIILVWNESVQLIVEGIDGRR